jgi:nucleoside-diphosphate-sugar epimerase
VAGEKIIEDASKRGLITAIVRFSNVFGSVHDHADRVIPAFCRASAQGTSIRVDGEDHVFDFTYIDDVVEGVLSLIRLLSQKCQSLPPIHLTSGHPKSLEEVAKFAQQSSEYPIVIVKGTPRSFDVSKFWGDTTRAQHILRWKACVTVEEGMSRLINQYRIFLGADQMLATR